MAQLYLRNKAIPFDSSLINVDLPELSPIELAAVDFCKQWMMGQPSFVISTSGSTGVPKSITLDREWMRLSAQETCKFLKLKKGQTTVVCLNTSYIAGKMMLVRAMECGLNAVIVEPSSNPLTTKINQAIDFLAVVPLQLLHILNDEDTTYKLNKMKAVIVGGAPINQGLREKCKSLRVPVYLTFGMTETVSHIALQRIDGSYAENHFTVLPHFTIRQDPRGCLEIKSKITSDKWLTTNDLIEMVNDNQFIWIGRIDQVINSGGIKIQIEKVESLAEAILLKKGLNNRFIISSVPDELLGEKIVLVVEGEGEETGLNNVDFENMDKFERPKLIIYLNKFPETYTSKIDRLSIKNIIS